MLERSTIFYSVSLASVCIHGLRCDDSAPRVCCRSLRASAGSEEGERQASGRSAAGSAQDQEEPADWNHFHQHRVRCERTLMKDSESLEDSVSSWTLTLMSCDVTVIIQTQMGFCVWPCVCVRESVWESVTVCVWESVWKCVRECVCDRVCESVCDCVCVSAWFRYIQCYGDKMSPQRWQYPKSLSLWRDVLVSMRKQVNKSHRMKCFENVKMAVVLCEG